MKSGNAGDHLLHVRWCDSMAGEEYARVHAFGSGPRRKVSLIQIERIHRSSRD